ncbi:MAG: type II toxin-antitoxin system RelE/ParE family toxin [Lachnospiraceae bacterium]|nr:type II toxin-antitoxin system RelE/ParE family toxin [Lachnospiraceae bacterium]
MAYKLIITERADELLDNIVYHMLYRLKNEQAAKHLLDGIENVYDRLETNPEQFPFSRDSYLAYKGYREAIVPQMDYVVVFGINNNTVSIVGIFHQLENYQRKL